MDVSRDDHKSDSTVVDFSDCTSNCQHTATPDDSMSPPCHSENRPSVADSIHINIAHRIGSRSGESDSNTSHAVDASSTAATKTEGALCCWGDECTQTHGTGHYHHLPERTDGTHIFFNDTIITQDYTASGNPRFHDTDGSGVNNNSETTEIVCDYASVCDDDNIDLEAMLPVACDEDRSKLLDNEVTRFSKTVHVREVSDNYTASSEVNSSTISSRQCERITKVSDALVGEQTSGDTTPISTVAAVYITSLLNQKTKMSEHSLPAVGDLHEDGQPPPSAVCVPPSQFSHLPAKLLELPPVPFPPIFYISMEENLPLNLAELCVAEKQNAVLKTDLPNVNPRFAERCDSQLSTFSEKQDICRICHCEAEVTNKLISPCLCSGSLKYIHLCCLQKWIKSSDKKSCELCNFDYIMTMKIRPFKQWDRLDMSVAERRKIVCSVTFHVIAITCVIWSLYVLIDRTTEEVNAGTLDWPFWTKLIVVAIGFTGGLVFMYVQCKMYLQLCFRWRQFNKLINIENAPEDIHLRAEAAARIKARSNEAGGVINTVALQEVDSF